MALTYSIASLNLYTVLTKMILDAIFIFYSNLLALLNAGNLSLTPGSKDFLVRIR